MIEKQTNLMLIGVGGGGCHFASAAVRAFGGALPAIGFDTDALATRGIGNMRCMIIGAPMRPYQRFWPRFNAWLLLYSPIGNARSASKSRENPGS